ncbi:HAD family hydrolase [Streptomyces oryzae]|uniref:HAD family hydrolase n=1 Tax=Streptomyces oryzae TaxID=1434886 RepID=UPI0027DDBC6C|nr:HAD family hydrolase [Streptomyces oryzae]
MLRDGAVRELNAADVVPGDVVGPDRNPAGAAPGALLCNVGWPAEPGELTPRVDEIPFSSERKRMTTVHRSDQDSFGVICKGAPEAVLQSDLITPDDAARRGETLKRAQEWASEGYRVLAVSAGDRGAEAAQGWERGPALLGLVAILAPPRPAATETIAARRAAGVTPVLVTGDHPLTAEAVARQLGIAAAGAGGDRSTAAGRNGGRPDGGAGVSLVRPLSRKSTPSSPTNGPGMWWP